MKNTISFLLDGRHESITFGPDCPYTPITTVLQYLRSLPDRKGTKEGCAEGDCGACTVVIGETAQAGTVRYTAVDSCLIFLPMLHGKQLLTVESLTRDEKHLHPVQHALVEKHGTQCGFCTPGFVMSMFALYKNHPNPTRETINDALTGNLCRCTGYRPIVEAAATVCVNERHDALSENESRHYDQLSTIIHGTIAIQTAHHRYVKPATLSEALLYLAEHPEALIISGATDIALRVTKKHESLTSILDLSDVPELKDVSESGDKLILGAGLSLNQVRAIVKTSHPALYDILQVFGSLQIRHLATLGGNLGSASPIGDTLPVLLAYQAKILLESVHGQRRVDMDAFITGYRTTVRKADEIITAVKLPKIQPGTIVRSYKVSKRKDLDISTVSAAFRLERSNDGAIRKIIMAYGGMAEKTKRAERTEAFLTGKPWTRATIESAMPLIDLEFRPISDARSGAEFRRTVARNLLLKFWSETNLMR
ncbi:MAG TPA: xanthine dehydrogenase small subunit [bacterium]|nr:xanthine dehydrogenase small subunit [bacterium]HMW34500.1 xanthine dehydrogenase small subunit [bacterium]HMZ03598.1 xanthine dehydrogenase small subunit [bacterium]HNB09503.1 xanthine dehydrogenase small subunit [bacterium]HND78447.1 xanthine dehydrogenase small subunit [bacterium]